MTLPIRRMVLYKHGVGFFERRGPVEADTLRLSFPRHAMDDILKSLLAIDMGSGHVLSLDFETPENREELLAKGSIHLSDNHTMLDLMRDLRGRMVRLSLPDDQTMEGMIVGIDYGHDDDPLQGAMVSLYQQAHQSISTLPLDTIQKVQLLDPAASGDLNYFLRASQSEEDRRSATLHLSEASDHDIIVSYIAPAPAWRVSYRMMVDTKPQEESSQNGSPPTSPAPTTCKVLIQAWGLFDNQLDEDLENVDLMLVAGMPISFRYRLYQPHTPERPLIEDEERTVNAPLFFDSAPPPAPQGMPAAAPQAKAARGEVRMMMAEDALGSGFSAMLDEEAELASPYSPEEMEESVQITASGSERGPLFTYYVAHPVNVARGQSAMVPIIGRRLMAQRDLLYNREKLPNHPVVSLRLTNDTNHTLERGPVTIIEDGHYAGEAVLPFTRKEAELIIPYAVEMGIKVEERYRNEQRIVSIHMRKEYLQIQEYHLRHTTYHLTSMLSKPVDVMIEHTLARNYELTDTPEPLEQSASFARWKIACPAHTRTTFDVHERTMHTRREHIRNLSGQQLQHFLTNKFLDSATINALKKILELYQQQRNIESQIKRIEREREAIYKKQKQIQGNLAPLGQSGEEGALRKRYVTELNSQEDRLALLAEEETRLQKTQESLEQEISQKIGEVGQQE